MAIHVSRDTRPAPKVSAAPVMGERVESDQSKSGSETTKYIISLAKEKFNGIIPDDVMKAIEDAERWSEVVPAQAAQWIFDSDRIARLILSGQAGPSDRSLAWIRLEAIVSELPAFFKRYKTLGGVEFDDLAMRTHLASGLSMANLTDKIISQFSAEELVMLEYLRNCQAHPFQDGYRLSLKVDVDGKITKKKFQKGGVSKLDLQRTIESEFFKYHANETKIQDAYFSKIANQLTELASLAKGLVK